MCYIQISGQKLNKVISKCFKGSLCFLVLEQLSVETCEPAGKVLAIRWMRTNKLKFNSGRLRCYRSITKPLKNWGIAISWYIEGLPYPALFLKAQVHSLGLASLWLEAWVSCLAHGTMADEVKYLPFIESEVYQGQYCIHWWQKLPEFCSKGLSPNLLPHPFNWRCKWLSLGPFACQVLCPWDVLCLATDLPVYCDWQ